jgi:hypothetical protein
MNAIPECLLGGETMEYDSFLEARRPLMTQKIKPWFEAL